jgi:hypothetical protein
MASEAVWERLLQGWSSPMLAVYAGMLDECWPSAAES